MNNLALAYRAAGTAGRRGGVVSAGAGVYRHISDPGREVAVLNNLGRAAGGAGTIQRGRATFREAIDDSPARRLEPTDPDVAVGSAIWGS